jgi:hypothetical protein
MYILNKAMKPYTYNRKGIFMSDDIFNLKKDRISSYVCFIFANSCMPTLIKAKPSTLVSFHKKYIEDKVEFFKAIKKEVWQFNCQYKLLCESESFYYILIYNIDLLDETFSRYSNHPVLMNAGYITGQNSIYKNLYHFKKRFTTYKISQTSDFPHEVGILLGYPIKDVEAYIANNGENYLLCGFWKVYYNVEEAGQIFESFRILRKEAVKLIFSGKELKDIMSCA